MAKRSRIVSQLLCESVMLSIAGGIAGLVVAVALDSCLLSIMPRGAAPLPIRALQTCGCLPSHFSFRS